MGKRLRNPCLFGLRMEFTGFSGILYWIRKLQNADMDRVAGIWLDANLRAHCFISPQYWKSNFAPVKEMLPRAEVYVYENDREIWGFIGLTGEYIEGIFVSGEMQSRGIGKRLLDFVKTTKTELRLHV